MRLEGELQSCKERLGLADEQRDELSARHEAELQQMPFQFDGVEVQSCSRQMSWQS